MRPEAAPALVNEAFARLDSGRRGPVSLEMPMDIMGRQADVELLRSRAHARAARDRYRPGRAGGEASGQGASADDRDRRRRASTHPRSCSSWRPLLQAPVVSFRSGRGVISDRHYLSQVLPAGYELWKTADVVLGIGTRMEQQLLHWKTTSGHEGHPRRHRCG